MYTAGLSKKRTQIILWNIGKILFNAYGYSTTLADPNATLATAPAKVPDARSEAPACMILQTHLKAPR